MTFERATINVNQTDSRNRNERMADAIRSLQRNPQPCHAAGCHALASCINGRGERICRMCLAKSKHGGGSIEAKRRLLREATAR